MMYNFGINLDPFIIIQWGVYHENYIILKFRNDIALREEGTMEYTYVWIFLTIIIQIDN